jgi:hydrogenase maturation protease
MGDDARPPTLVLGVGNILLGDEGFGVRVIEAMQESVPPPGVELYNGATAGIDLVEVMGGRRKLIVIDVIAAEGEPGTVLRLTPDDLPPASGYGASVHDFGIMEALELTRRLGNPAQEVVLVAAIPKQISFGLELSAELTAVIPKVIELVLEEAGGQGSTSPVYQIISDECD